MCKSGSVYTTLLLLISQHQLRFGQSKLILEQYYLSRFQEMCPKVSSIQVKHLQTARYKPVVLEVAVMHFSKIIFLW